MILHPSINVGPTHFIMNDSLTARLHNFFLGSMIGFLDKRNAGRCQISVSMMIIGVMT